MDRPRRTTANYGTRAPPAGGGRRREQNNLIQCLLAAILLYTNVAEAKKGDLTRQGSVKFVEEKQVIFSESSWTIIADRNLNPVYATIGEVERGLRRFLNTTGNNENTDNSLLPGCQTFRQTMKQQIIHRATRAEERLQELTNRMKQVHATMNGRQRHRRALMNAGGKALKWLFGVTTTEDLEVINDQVHRIQEGEAHWGSLVQQQASIVNDSLWESKATTLSK